MRARQGPESTTLLLNSRQIREAIATGELSVEPDVLDSRIQPASLDVHLGSRFITFDARCGIDAIDPKVDTSAMLNRYDIGEGECFTLEPGELVLATTAERIGLADSLAARVEGRSSVGRLGLLVHITAGFVDPGWALAPITLEVATVGRHRIRLWPGMPIAQLSFERLEPTGTYAGKYVGQGGPTPSRLHQNWTGVRWT